ncbi:MAG: hypothetical protein JWM04_2594 [Verrucomicrobiales bacterium]|nr:hypothetical protein [Verrucomicrobiales bacterium]
MKGIVFAWLCMVNLVCNGQIVLGKTELKENTVVEFDIPLSATVRAQFIQLGQSTVTVARAGIYLPAGFSMNGINHFVLINSTSDGKASSIGSLRSFASSFQTNNCLGIAADGPGGKLPGDSAVWRYGLEKTALDYIRAVWPQSRKWPIICAGFSGGSKWSPYMAGMLFRDKYTIEGIFMGGCNEDKVSAAKTIYGLGPSFLTTPLFLSGGDMDPVATPDQTWAVYDSLKRTGFTRVRYQTHPGGHTLGKGHFLQALEWFTSGAVATSAPPTRPPAPPFTNDLKVPKTIRVK